MRAFRFLPFFSLLFSLAAHVAQAAAPSGETWFTLTTPHFRVHHTQPLETYARHFAFSLERSLPLLEASLKWKAPTPFDVVVMDPSDSANGLAMNFPNTHIEVFATPFEHDSVLSHYYDWVNELATHELTHIIANDSTLGFYKYLRTIFGSWVKPNGLQPTWLIEGLAVYQETALSPAGRGRSPWLEAILGEAVRRNKLTDRSYTSLDRFNDGNPWWPAGNMAYLLGYTIQSAASAEKPGFPGDVSYHNAGLIPFMPNRSAEDLTGKDYAELWKQTDAKLHARYSPKDEESCFLTRSGAMTGGQAVSVDGWIYFSEQDWDQGHRLSRIRADAPCGGSAKPQRLFHKELNGASQIAVSDDGAHVAFSAFDRPKYEYFFSDLYLWHRDGRWTEQLTDGRRARDPAFSGNDLFYIYQKEDTSQSIRRRHLPNGTEVDLFTSRPLERLSGLHARGDTLLFSRHDNRGQEKILRLSTAGGDAEILITDAKPFRRIHERNPFLAADGSVLFSRTIDDESDKSGTQSIYRYVPASKKLAPFYVSPSGFVDRPSLLPDGQVMIAQGYHLGGTDLIRVAPSKEVAAAPSPKEDLHQFLSGQPQHETPPPTEQELASVGNSAPYSSLRTPATSLWPQYWLPYFSAETDGWVAGATTSGNDPLEYHRYFLSAQYDSRASFPVFRAFYRNRTFPTQFHVEARQVNNYFLSSKTSNRSTIYSAEAIIPVREAFYSFGTAFQERRLFGRQAQSISVFQQLYYYRAGKTPSAVENNFGNSFRVYAGLYPNASSEKLFADLRPQANFYFRGFHPSHSVSVAAHAGITTNKFAATNYYLGGGPSVLSDSEFVIRGYPVDTLFGQRITTANLAYTLPLAHPYRGWRTNPLFLESIGLRFTADAGSANFVALYRNDSFVRYRPSKLGERILLGYGAELVTNGSVFYHIPVTLVTGAHYGVQKSAGGGFSFYTGLNVGLPGDYARPPETAEDGIH